MKLTPEEIQKQGKETKKLELPECCQPDSDCADEIRKGNLPPCKVNQALKEGK